MKIDPKNVTNFSRTQSELETFWLFCTFVAGKNADTAADKLSKFLSRKPADQTPFEYLRGNENDLRNMLVAHKVGQYGRLTRTIADSVKLDLNTCTVEDLEGVYGVGPKTARMFILHTRKNAQHAVLDVHILRWLRQHQGGDKLMEAQIPQQTPQDPKKYADLERRFIMLATTYYAGVPLADVDLLLWTQMSGRNDNDTFEPTLPGTLPFRDIDLA